MLGVEAAEQRPAGQEGGQDRNAVVLLQTPAPALIHPIQDYITGTVSSVWVRLAKFVY